MEQVCYGIAVLVYSIFIIRFILSWIGGDFDLDADTDLDLGDVISFKGLTHFLMGFSGWLSTKSLITHNVMWYDYLIGFILGLVFVIMLYYLYKFMFKLEHKPEVLTGKALEGLVGRIYLLKYFDSDNTLYHYIVQVNNGVGTVEVTGVCPHRFNVGDSVKLGTYGGGTYLIQ